MDPKDINPVPSMALPGPSHSGAARDAIAGPMDAPQAGSSRKAARGGGKKKRKDRKQSFVGQSRSGFDNVPEDDDTAAAESPHASPETTRFWNRGSVRRISESSLDSETLLDHRYVRVAPGCSMNSNIQK